MRNMFLPFALAVMLGIAGCAGSATPPPPSTTVAALEVALTAADQTALAYVTLPACPSANGTLCSTAATVAQIKQSSLVAYNAVKDVQSGKGTVAIAQSAIAALVAVTPVAPVK